MFSLRLPAFDELLTAIAARRQDQPGPDALEPVRRSISLYLETLASAFINPAPESPHPRPGKNRGTATTKRLGKTYADAVRRRKLLHGLIRQHGWCWEDVERLVGENVALPA